MHVFVNPSYGYRSKASSDAVLALADDNSGALLTEYTSLLGAWAMVPTLLALQEPKHAAGPFALVLGHCVGVGWQGGILASQIGPATPSVQRHLHTA